MHTVVRLIALSAVFVPIFAWTSPTSAAEPKGAVSAYEQAIREQDELAIAKLAKQGEDMSGPRTIDHYLYLETKGSAAAIANELRQHGYRVEVRLGVSGPPWLVVASHDAILTEPKLRSVRRDMEALIAKFGPGVYDGWGAAGRPLR